MNTIVKIVDEEIRLCSGMGEMAFGKTNYNSIVTQEGLIATCKTSSDASFNFSFEPWSFKDVKSYEVEGRDERIVFYCNSNPFTSKAKTLLELFEAAGNENATIEDKDAMYISSFAVCSVLTQAAKENINIPLNGAGGILVDTSTDEIKLLFLPHNLFKYSLGGLSAVDKANNHDCWINPSLDQLPAICFERASIAYKMLTGRFAYASSDSTERNADILDKRFLPLELSINGINEELALAVNNALKLTANSVDIPGKKAKGKKSEDLLPEPDFPLEQLKTAKENINSKISDKDFEEKVNAFIKLQNSQVNTKRTIRRNTSKIVAGIVAVIALVIIIRSTINGNLENYTSKGLTSTQTIEAFFKGMNNLDIPFIEKLAKGRNASKYIDTISNMYVISKQRQSMGGDNGVVNPAKYFVVVKNPITITQTALYGASRIKIDGKSTDADLIVKKNKDKPEPVTQEQGITLENGAKSVHSVEYYLMYSEGEKMDIFAEKCTDTFTLTYEKDKWIITDIETAQKTVYFDSDTFKQEFFSLLEKNNGDPVQAVNILSDKYEFMPTQSDMTKNKKAYEDFLNNPYKDIIGNLF